MSSFVCIMLVLIVEYGAVEGQLEKNWHFVDNTECQFKHLFGRIEQAVDDASKGLPNSRKVVAFAFREHCFYQLVAIISAKPDSTMDKKYYCMAFEVQGNVRKGFSAIRSNDSIEGVIFVETNTRGLYPEGTIELAMDYAEKLSLPDNWQISPRSQASATSETEQSGDSCTKKIQTPILERGNSFKRRVQRFSKQLSSSSLKNTSQTQI